MNNIIRYIHILSFQGNASAPLSRGADALITRYNDTVTATVGSVSFPLASPAPVGLSLDIEDWLRDILERPYGY